MSNNSAPIIPLGNDELRQIAVEVFSKAATETKNLSVAGYLNRKHMAAWIDRSPSFLDKLVRMGLKPIDIDGCRLYGKQDVAAFLKKYQQ